MAGLALGLVLLAGPATAGPIVQPVDGFGANFGAGVFGQSFAAEDPALASIGIYVADWNPFLGSPFRLTLTLYAGSGFDGPLVGSQSDALPDGHGGVNGPGAWWDFDLTGTTLLVGNAYTFSIDSPNHRGGIFYSGVDEYRGGQMFLNGSPVSADLAFRVLPEQNAVPEPTALVLLGSGLTGLYLVRRRTRRS